MRQISGCQSYSTMQYAYEGLMRPLHALLGY